MRTYLSFAEHVGAAVPAETSMHSVAAVGDALIVAQLAFDLHCRTRETDVHRVGARAEVLAGATPAGASDDRRRGYDVADRFAETAAGDLHGQLLFNREHA